MRHVVNTNRGILGEGDPSDVWENIIRYIPDEVLLMSGVRILVVAAGYGTEADMLVQRMKKLDIKLFTDPTKTFIDPSCGDGQFLGEILIRKMQNGISFENALETVYGVDLMQDNVDLCRERLLCGRDDLRHVVEKNIVCADGLRYHYRFDNSYPYDNEENDPPIKNLYDNFFG